jgi:FkbM family methyltransferase
VIARLRRLWNRPDFRAHPLAALARRFRWRWRWLWINEPWPLPLAPGLTILTPRSGSGALVYYQGGSEPETTAFLQQFLQPGMTFLDVGAHFGEHTLVASRCVGDSGQIHAFEPEPEMFALLERNVYLNPASNTTLNRCAVGDRDGEMAFWQRFEPASSSLQPPSAALTTGDVRRVLNVPVCSLDRYCREHACAPDLIKVDVEGAERLVFLGARGLCSLPPEEAPVWVFEYSSSSQVRFGERPEDLFATLEAFGYHCAAIAPDGSATPVRRPIPPDAPTANLIASKRRWP